MSTVSYRYNVYCVTENKWVESISSTKTTPTCCPNNILHTINAPATHYVNVVNSNEVVISLENEGLKTGGDYSMHGRSFYATGVSEDRVPVTTVDSYAMDIPIVVTSGFFTSRPELSGDEVTVSVLPQFSQTVGVCTANVTDGDSVISVSPSAVQLIELTKVPRVVFREVSSSRESDKVEVLSIDSVNNTITLKDAVNINDGNPLSVSNTVNVVLDTNIVGVVTAPYTTDNVWIQVNSFEGLKPGRFVTLFQSNSNYTQERMIHKLDGANMKIKVNKPFDVALNPAVSTVYVQLSINMVYKYELEPVETINPGQDTIGGKYLDNVVILFKYTRKSPGDVKVRYKYQILY